MESGDSSSRKVEGTRFVPGRKAQPKGEMTPIVVISRPFNILSMKRYNRLRILISLRVNKQAIEDHFDKSIELEMLLQNEIGHKADLA